MGSGIKVKTAVVIDYQNVQTRGSWLFAREPSTKLQRNFVNPVKFAETVISVRNASRRSAGTLQLAKICVFRGLPNADADPEENSNNQSQKAQWEKSSPVPIEINHRNVSYKWNPLDKNGGRKLNELSHPRFPGKAYSGREEKGIDVLCAISVLKQLQDATVDAVILASIDSDLEPALEEGRQINPEKTLETVSWYAPDQTGGRNRIGQNLGLWNTRLHAGIFYQVLD
jgi:hypothetical protein